MDLVYNELSSTPISTSRLLADEKMELFIKTYSSAFSIGFKQIRFSESFQDIFLSEGYSISSWLDSTKSKNLKDLFLSSFKYPFIGDDDEQAIEKYVSNYYYIYTDTEQSNKCDGLAAACIYNTSAISFADNEYWKTNILHILRKSSSEVEHESEKLEVLNIFSTDCSKNIIIKDLLNKAIGFKINKSIIRPQDKSIDLREDHGKDILKAFANKLVNSPYVVSIINSLPFNPRAHKFIKNIYDNGTIELVLHWEDEGFGMVIQTTGKDISETKEIARMLEEDYG